MWLVPNKPFANQTDWDTNKTDTTINYEAIITAKNQR